MLGHEPPIYFRSITPVFIPSLASDQEINLPAAPLPRTRRSYFSICDDDLSAAEPLPLRLYCFFIVVLGSNYSASQVGLSRNAVSQRGLDEVNLDWDIPSRGFGVGARVMSAVQDRLRDLAFQAGQTDIE